MCGICGTVGRADERELGLMTDAMAHRGPDGRGVVTFPGDPPAGLGHRRLAILDPTPAGAQPMSFAERWWITYNGELYNFRELRAELEAAGERFASDCDTEVLLRLFALEGPAMLDAPQRDLRVRRLGRSRQEALPGSRPARRQAALRHPRATACSGSRPSSGRSSRSSAAHRSTRRRSPTTSRFSGCPIRAPRSAASRSCLPGTTRGSTATEWRRGSTGISRFVPEERPEREWVDAVAETVTRERAKADGERRPARRVPERRRRLVGDRRGDVLRRRSGEHLHDRLRRGRPPPRDRARRRRPCAARRDAVRHGLDRADPRAERPRSAPESGVAPRGAGGRSGGDLHVPDLPRGTRAHAGDAQRHGRRRGLRRLPALPRVPHSAVSSTTCRAPCSGWPSAASRESHIPGGQGDCAARAATCGSSCAARDCPRSSGTSPSRATTRRPSSRGCVTPELGAALGDYDPLARHRALSRRDRRPRRAQPAAVPRPQDVPPVPQPDVYGQDVHGGVGRGARAPARRRARRAGRPDSVVAQAARHEAQVRLQEEPGARAPARHRVAAKGGLRGARSRMARR